MLSQAQSAELKARVTSRLRELDLMVDEELADYVCVLVQNDKNQQEISSDLELFLSDQAASFSTWLMDETAKLKEKKSAAFAAAASESQKAEKPRVVPSVVVRRSSSDARADGRHDERRSERRESRRDDPDARQRRRSGEGMVGWSDDDSGDARPRRDVSREDTVSARNTSPRRSGAAVSAGSKRVASAAFRAIQSGGGREEGTKKRRADSQRSEGVVPAAMGYNGVTAHGWKPTERSSQRSEQRDGDSRISVADRLGTSRKSVMSRLKRADDESMEVEGEPLVVEVDEPASNESDPEPEPEVAPIAQRRAPIESRLGPRVGPAPTKSRALTIASHGQTLVLPPNAKILMDGYAVSQHDAARALGRGRGARGRARGRGRTFQRFEAYSNPAPAAPPKTPKAKGPNAEVAAIGGMLKVQEKRQKLLSEQMAQQKVLLSKLETVTDPKERKELVQFVTTLAKSIKLSGAQLKETAAEIAKAQDHVKQQAEAVADKPDPKESPTVAPTTAQAGTTVA